MKKLVLSFTAILIIFVSSCKKENVEPVNQTTKKQELFDVKKGTKKVLVKPDDILILKKDIEYASEIIKDIDTSLIGKYRRGEISEDILFSNLTPEQQTDILNVTDMLNAHLTKIKEKYHVESYDNIDWYKSFIISSGNLNKNINKCDDEYTLASAANFAAFIEASTACIYWIELPPVAAGCIMAASAYYAYQQQQAVDAYNDCLSHQ